MKGSVRKRGTTWSYRIDFGKVDGKRNQIEKGGYKTKKEADKALNDVLYQINNTGDYVENKKITFKEVYTEFIEKEAPATRAYATIVRYKSLYKNHFADQFDSFYILSHTNIKLTEDGGAMPYKHSKDNKYLIDDLSVSDINDLKFIELEETVNEENSEHK